jgi:PPOX class probable F420-dependent enzyme
MPFWRRHGRTVNRRCHPSWSPSTTRHAVISTRETAYKVRNVRRHPRAWLCVLPDRFFGGQWLQIEGPAQVLSLPDAMDPLIAYYRSISGEHPEWDDYRQAMRRDRRCLIRIRVERAGPDRQG